MNPLRPRSATHLSMLAVVIHSRCQICCWRNICSHQNVRRDGVRFVVAQTCLTWLTLFLFLRALFHRYASFRERSLPLDKDKLSVKSFELNANAMEPELIAAHHRNYSSVTHHNCTEIAAHSTAKLNRFRGIGIPGHGNWPATPFSGLLYLDLLFFFCWSQFAFNRLGTDALLLLVPSINSRTQTTIFSICF